MRRVNKKPVQPQGLPDVVKIIAAPGILQPISYLGSIIYIKDSEPVELDLNKLKYQSRAQLDRAMAEGELIKVEE